MTWLLVHRISNRILQFIIDAGNTWKSSISVWLLLDTCVVSHWLVYSYTSGPLHRHKSNPLKWCHMRIIAFQTTRNLTACWIACSGWQQRKHQNSTLVALCVGNLPVTGGFPSQRANNEEIISVMSWCYYPYDWSVPEEWTITKFDSIHINTDILPAASVFALQGIVCEALH